MGGEAVGDVHPSDYQSMKALRALAVRERRVAPAYGQAACHAP
jgi:hypothetical protein